MSSYVNWSWASEHVQTEITNGEYVSSESTLVLAGPSRLAHLSAGASGALSTTNSVIPLGLIQNVGITQQRQLSRLFEIGSKRAYFVPGRLFSNFTIGRILFYGPSLLRLLYALAPLNDDQLGTYGTDLNVDPDSSGDPISIPPAYADLFQTSQLATVPGYGATQPETQNRDFFINLASELFNVPFGMILVFKDTRNRPYGAMFLEDCYIETHNMGVDANAVVIGESVTGQFDSIAPIQLATQSSVYGPGL